MFRDFFKERLNGMEKIGEEGRISRICGKDGAPKMIRPRNKHARDLPITPFNGK